MKIVAKPKSKFLVSPLKKFATVMAKELELDTSNLIIKIEPLLDAQKGAFELPKKKTTAYLHMSINDDLGFPMICRALAHELTHVAQYKQGRLVFGEEGVVFEGVVYPEANLSPSVDGARLSEDEYLAYKALPWEAEAYANEDRLYDIAKEKLKNLKVKVAGEEFSLF
ncbi:hypothetical protein AB4254_11680 [Vibrio breoganii]